MIIQLYDANHFIISCTDRDLLEVMKERMDGRKVYGEDRIIIPLRSGPKIHRFQQYGIEWGRQTREVVDHLAARIAKRKQNIQKIRSQYGGDIKFDYHCQGEYEPMDHQKIMFNVMVYSDVAAILADPGTCKTGPYLWAIDARIQRGLVKKALVITLSSLKKNILAEMVVQVPHLRGVVLSNPTQAEKLLQKTYKVKKRNIDYDIYIANYESMFTFVKLFPADYFDMVVLDEAHRVGSPKARQTKNVVNKFESVPYKYIVTATLHANHLMSFFMPFRFMGPDTVPYANYYGFRRTYMYAVDPDGHIWKPVPGAMEAVRKMTGNISVLFTKEECLDLPPLIRQTYSSQLGPKQKKLYDQMKDDSIAIIDDMCSKCDKRDACDKSCEESVSAKSALVLIGKLTQITCGFYRNTRYEVDAKGKQRDISNIITLEENPKLSLLIQTLDSIPPMRKVIIWTHYIHAVETIRDALMKAFGKKSTLTCYQSQNAFDQVQRFKDPDVTYMVANPAKLGIGQNIQFSCYQVFFSNSYSWILREQAEGRQHRQGQTEKVTAINLVLEGTVDEVTLKALLLKRDLALNLSQWSRVLKNPKEIDAFLT